MFNLNLYFYSTICDRLWNKKLSRNDLVNVKFNNLLSGEIIDSVRDKYKLLKKKIIDLEEASTEEYERKSYALEHNNNFQKDNVSLCSDATSPELDYLMENSEF
ncbi:Plasmodium exported protein, unknown function [Plasmodium malariae]|uniref:Uncharacterized protein n=1 Tax=Plasmodium malariae TaxID=5858 RepID=A0A1A8WIA3_PLAMA|nr:Plasmodium exported protein, unknown function [Plasmodium malariae]